MFSEKNTANVPIFIIGLPRSGSTLWWKVIGSHSDLAFFTEVHFLSVWHKDFRNILKDHVGDLSKRQNIVKLLDIIFSKNHIINPPNTIWFWNQIRSLEKHGLKQALFERIASSEKRDIGSLFRILIEEATYCQGVKRAVVKFPVYPVFIGRLLKWWPNCKIIHISRDPRAIAVSKTNDPGGVAGLIARYRAVQVPIRFAYRYFAVFQYIWMSYIHVKFKDEPNYKLFFYEDLVTRPESVIRELCEFCDISFDYNMLMPSAGQASSITGEKAEGFDAARAKEWQKVLSKQEACVIGSLTKSSMRRFGYKPD